MNHRWKAALVLGALTLASAAAAQPAAPEPAASEPVYQLVPEPADPSPPAPSAADPAGGPSAAPTATERGPQRPKLVGKPSGFWTSPRPARGGAYRYRMLGIGIVLLALTGFVTLRVLRKHGVRVPDADRPYARRPTA